MYNNRMQMYNNSRQSTEREREGESGLEASFRSQKKLFGLLASFQASFHCIREITGGPGRLWPRDSITPAENPFSWATTEANYATSTAPFKS